MFLFKKARLDRNCGNTRGCSQYPFAGHSLFRPRFHRARQCKARPLPRYGVEISFDCAREGPLMTVDSIRGNQVDCFWTGGDGQPNAESFPIDVLQKF
jgi:hypothetical protein